MAETVHSPKQPQFCFPDTHYLSDQSDFKTAATHRGSREPSSKGEKAFLGPQGHFIYWAEEEFVKTTSPPFPICCFSQSEQFSRKPFRDSVWLHFCRCVPHGVQAQPWDRVICYGVSFPTPSLTLLCSQNKNEHGGTNTLTVFCSSPEVGFPRQLGPWLRWDMSDCQVPDSENSSCRLKFLTQKYFMLNFFH